MSKIFSNVIAAVFGISFIGLSFVQANDLSLQESAIMIAKGKADHKHDKAGEQHGKAGEHGKGSQHGEAGKIHGKAGDAHGIAGDHHSSKKGYAKKKNAH